MADPAEEDRFDRAVTLMVNAARMAAPGEARKQLELVLLSAVMLCKVDGQMSHADTFNSIDMLLSHLAEQSEVW